MDFLNINVRDAYDLDSFVSAINLVSMSEIGCRVLPSPRHLPMSDSSFPDSENVITGFFHYLKEDSSVTSLSPTCNAAMFLDGNVLETLFEL